MAAIKDIKTIVLSGFKKGSTIDQLAVTYMNLEKESGNKMLRKDARAQVEKIILEDYLHLAYYIKLICSVSSRTGMYSFPLRVPTLLSIFP